MRIIKLSKEKEFPTRHDLENYFNSILLEREIVGRFNLTPKKIRRTGKQALFRGEMLLFTWDTELVRIGRSASEQIYTDGSEKYPSYFVLDMNSVKIPKRLLYQSDLDISLSGILSRKIVTGSQGFNWIEEIEEVEDWFETL
jgi:hypothetical protein